MLDRGNYPGASFISFLVVELKQKFCPAEHLKFCSSWVIILKILILEGTARKLLLTCFILCKKSNPVYPDSVKWTRNPDSTKHLMSVLMSISSN